MDDLQRLHPENVTMGDAGMTGRMMRTKCSGTAKKVRELLLFVSRALGAGSEGLAADRLQALEGGRLVRARLLFAADFVRLRDLHPEAGVE